MCVLFVCQLLVGILRSMSTSAKIHFFYNLINKKLSRGLTLLLYLIKQFLIGKRRVLWLIYVKYIL